MCQQNGEVRQKYKQDSTWTAFKHVWDIYKKMMNEAKNYSSVIPSGRDMKKLYNLVSNMIGRKMENPMLEHDSNIELVN